MKMRSDANTKRETPESSANVVYEAARDNKKRLHYTAGSIAGIEYQWLQKDGFDTEMHNAKIFGITLL